MTDNIQKNDALSFASHDNDDDNDDTTTAAIMGGLTRGILYSLKNMFGNINNVTIMLQGMLRKQSFLHLGKRSTTTSSTTSKNSIHSSSLNDLKVSSSPPLLIIEPAYSHTQKNNNMNIESSSSSKGIRWTIKSLEMIKSSILGMAVFGIYDYLVDYDHHQPWSLSNGEEEEEEEAILQERTTDGDEQPHSSSSITASPTSPERHSSGGGSSIGVLPAAAAPAAAAPILEHVGAGALAGLVQSMILDSWEVASYYIRHQHIYHSPVTDWSNWKTIFLSQPATPSSNNNNFVGTINTQLVYRRAVHHSLGYATLFGCYEAFRRILLHLLSVRIHVHDDDQHDRDNVADSSSSHNSLADNIIPWDNSSCSNDSRSMIETAARPVVASFVAGGLAGQAHYCMSYYTRHWKWQHHHHHHSSHILHPKKQQHHQHTHMSFPMAVATQKIPLPQWSAIRGAFIPTAITFVAFQYGGQVLAKVMSLIHKENDADS